MIFIILIVYLLVLIVSNTRYYFWYPSINTYLLGYGVPYPNNSIEIPIILNEYVVKKTQKDIDFFFLTDISVIPAFQTIILENEFKKRDMQRILFSSEIPKHIYIYKRIYNRARPHQVVPEEISMHKGTMLLSKTAFTPAYPSGHAFQSYYLARVLSIQFPEKKEKLIQMTR
jgi:hypothetical protein